MTSPMFAGPSFDNVQSAPYAAAERRGGEAVPPPTARYWSTATLAPAAPLPQDAWLLDLPEVDPLPARPERRLPPWLRMAGLAVATLLALFALGLAASLLDAQGLHRADGGERVAALAGRR